MAVDEEPDAMTSAVVVGFSLFPEELAGKRIELMSGGSFGENLGAESDVPFEYECEVVALLIGRFSQDDCPGDVGGAVGVLASAVDEQDSVSLDSHVGGFGGFVMHDRAVSFPTHDGGEALVHACRVGEAQLAQAFAEFHFGQLPFGIFFFCLLYTS